MRNIYSDINDTLDSRFTLEKINELDLVKDFLKANNLEFNNFDIDTEKMIYYTNRVNWHSIACSSYKNHNEDFYVYHVEDIRVMDIEYLIFMTGRVWKRSTLELYAARLTPDALDYFWERVERNRVCSDSYVF